MVMVEGPSQSLRVLRARQRVVELPLFVGQRFVLIEQRPLLARFIAVVRTGRQPSLADDGGRLRDPTEGRSESTEAILDGPVTAFDLGEENAHLCLAIT